MCTLVLVGEENQDFLCCFMYTSSMLMFHLLLPKEAKIPEAAAFSNLIIQLKNSSKSSSGLNVALRWSP